MSARLVRFAAFSACLVIGVATGPAVHAAPVQDAPAPPPEAAAASAADADSAAAPSHRRAAEIGGLFQQDPGGYEEIFAPGFLSQVSTSALDQIFTGYHDEHGRVVAVDIVGPFTGGTTVVRLRFADETAALLTLTVEPEAPHRVTGAMVGPSFELEGPDGTPTLRVRDRAYETDSYVTRTRLRLPFEGAWWVFWGGRRLEQNYHRASSLQRYAYDFIIRRGGSSHRGDGLSNDDYWCEGEPVLAPAPGTVAVAVDGVPENVPGRMNEDQKLGNHVVIDHGNGEFSLLAHLQTGSVSVDQGEAVEAGRRVGACGNSGNSSEPHLHYQLQTGPDFFASRSIPAPFHDYVSGGDPVASGEPERGQIVMPAPPADGGP